MPIVNEHQLTCVKLGQVVKTSIIEIMAQNIVSFRILTLLLFHCLLVCLFYFVMNYKKLFIIVHFCCYHIV